MSARALVLALFLSLTSAAGAVAQYCYQCHINFPPGLQCRRENEGGGVCWEDAQGCHVSGGCVPEGPIPSRVQAQLGRYGESHVSLVRLVDGRLFVVADDGSGAEVTRSASQNLTVSTCDGGEMQLMDYVQQKRDEIVARSLNREAQAFAMLGMLTF